MRRCQLMSGCERTTRADSSLTGIGPSSASRLITRSRVSSPSAREGRGRRRLAGVSRADDSAAGWARRIGYVGASAGIYAWMTPAEVLELAGRLAGYDRAAGRPGAPAP